MTKPELLYLLGVIAANDGRPLNDDVKLVWGTAAAKHGWNLGDCLRAVEAFFESPLEANQRRPWFDPGHMRHMLRVVRPGGTGPAPARDLLALPAAPVASAERRAEHLAVVRAILEAQGVDPHPRPRIRPAVRGGELIESNQAERAPAAIGGFFQALTRHMPDSVASRATGPQERAAQVAAS